MCVILALIRILSLVIHCVVASQMTSGAVDSESNNRSLRSEPVATPWPTRVAAKPGETAAHDLASSWCSAYRSSDPGRLAALETREIEIVDRFGDWQDLLGLNAREQFWKEGFGIASRKDFRPECSVLHIRPIGLTAAIAQVQVSYDGGIGLKDGDRIPPFSEIHTLILVRNEDTWLISAQDIVQQGSRK